MSAPGHNRLAVLAADIRSAHADVQASACATAHRAVDAGRLLNEAKRHVAHGSWAGWITDNIGLSQRTARRYMQLAASGLETATVADLGIKAASAAVARSRRPLHQRVDEAEYQAWRHELDALLWAGEARWPGARERGIALLGTAFAGRTGTRVSKQAARLTRIKPRRTIHPEATR